MASGCVVFVLPRDAKKRKDESARPPARSLAHNSHPCALTPTHHHPSPACSSSLPQAVDYAINSAWKSNNKGKLYEDCVAAGTIGGAVAEDE